MALDSSARAVRAWELRDPVPPLPPDVPATAADKRVTDFQAAVTIGCARARARPRPKRSKTRRFRKNQVVAALLLDRPMPCAHSRACPSLCGE